MIENERVSVIEGPLQAAELQSLIETSSKPFLLQVPEPGLLDLHPGALPRLIQAAQGSGALAVFGDYMDQLEPGRLRPHPLADWQFGSLAHDHPLGPAVLWSRELLLGALHELGGLRDHPLLPWYALRLAGSRLAPILRLPEPLGTLRPLDRRASGDRVFDYLRAAREQQAEAERTLVGHLQALGALLRPPFRTFESSQSFALQASVVIPVRNRARTIGQAIASALSQDCPFDFNVIVVDNHSDDGTTPLIAEMAARESRIVHVIPDRHDLGIGGCWNQAVFHPSCGRVVVQLDSDDLYASPATLARVVAALDEQQAGMAVGAYTLVNFALEVIPPGLIDHREWTAENGPNNALRVGGLGAPRAFATELLRASPFPNASYGEDYSVALRICREYRVARVWESLYLCRRWDDNTDADLSPELGARHQLYKDRVRSLELLARQILVRDQGRERGA